MSDVILARGTELAAARVGAIVTQLKDVLATDVPPDVAVAADNNNIILSGKNLVARYAIDVRLYGIGMTAKAHLA